ncbi:MAG: hypothetical protein ABIR18_05610 [Chitinophagaceae bacterium]
MIEFRRLFIYTFFLTALFSCNNQSSKDQPASITSTKSYAVESMINSDPAMSSIALVSQRSEKIKKALAQPVPVLFLENLDNNESLAQIIASSDPRFRETLFDKVTGKPYLNEVFNIYAARPQEIPAGSNPSGVYRVELYNYALNLSTVCLVDVTSQQLISINTFPQTQPDLNKGLEDLAIQIAINSPEVINALGGKPGEQEALMAATKTALNKTKCERSMHLCVAPTFIKNDKALWAIVDLTESRLVGIRWTNVGTTGPAERISERKLLFEKIMECNCKEQKSVERNGWKMNYVLTSSDGLRISEVYYKGQLVIHNAKLVDWHVSYSGTDGFGYSDAVGCPEFSHAAVVAVSLPKIEELIQNGKTVGFVLEQSYQSEQWPRPCNYNYVQRYEFYNDGSFKTAASSLGRGCGSDGTYRPVTRIVFAGEQNNFSEWDSEKWQPWTTEQWSLQKTRPAYYPNRYGYRIADNQGKGFYMIPGTNENKNIQQGDNAYTYVTKFHTDKDEGETDMVTIGPCCNTDYRQGPEKFLEPGENIKDSRLVIWYVAQLKNDDTPGRENCWAESYLENGIYKTKAYPCMSGPLFIPIE